jgi:hypothetical protein
VSNDYKLHPTSADLPQFPVPEEVTEFEWAAEMEGTLLETPPDVFIWEDKDRIEYAIPRHSILGARRPPDRSVVEVYYRENFAGRHMSILRDGNEQRFWDWYTGVQS